MAFTDALDVNIGDPTKASDYDTLADNPEWLRSKSDVDHNFDITTGTGYHKASYNAATHFYSGTNYVFEWWDFTDTAKPVKRYKVGIGSVPTPASVTDGDFFMASASAGGQGPPTIG